ncbi:MAG TPA: zf-HC2 domain-containing protein [Pyrinomonadaceae bacterium]|nr:zf-HC2 domain-containing protein [Pyrinomonadaceae bacterium]
MNQSQDTCQLQNVAAYLDGELTGLPLDQFEQHLKECSSCAQELRVQRQLLCTLEVAFGNSHSFDLPEDFTRVVTARAENDLRTIRHRHERKRAVQLCAILAAVSFVFLGAATRAVVLEPLRSFWRTTRVLLDFGWQALSNAGATIVVLARMAGRALVESQAGSRLLLTITFFISLVCLSLLIAKYRRAEIVE